MDYVQNWKKKKDIYNGTRGLFLQWKKKTKRGQFMFESEVLDGLECYTIAL